MTSLTQENFCQMVDHTLLRPTAEKADIEQLCSEALEHQFFAVCVNPFHLPLAKRILSGSRVAVATVCDFPLGSSLTGAALKECELSLEAGADEIDFVLNVGALKEGRFSDIKQEIQSLKQICGPRILKVILEVSWLSPEEIIKACEISQMAGADFVKTSTGFSSSGASVEAVALMRKSVGPDKGVKASGGIRDLSTALAMVRAGANRLGLSASVSILNELKAAQRGDV